jgi:hypothetical protein
MSPVGFEPSIPESERPQTYALDCAATGIGFSWKYSLISFILYSFNDALNCYGYMDYGHTVKSAGVNIKKFLPALNDKIISD